MAEHLRATPYPPAQQKKARFDRPSAAPDDGGRGQGRCCVSRGWALCHEHSAKLVPVGGVEDTPQVLDGKASCVVFISPPPRRHRTLFPHPTPARRAPARIAPPR